MKQELLFKNSFNFDILPYQEHYYYIVNINKFKVRQDGKLNRYMGMSLVHAERLTQNLIHIKHIKDSYFVGSSDRKIYFYELDEESQKFAMIEGVPEIKLDSSEVDVLTKSMSTKLLKDEILAFEAYGLLKQEVTKDVQCFEDSLSSNSKVFFLVITTNMKIYTFKIDFPHNEFLFLQLKEEENDEKLIPLSWTYLCSLKIEAAWDTKAIRVIHIGNERLVMHVNKDQVWHITINRKLDAYYKNIEYSLEKSVIWECASSPTSKFIDLLNEKGNKFECKLLLEGVKDFITLKLPK